MTTNNSRKMISAMQISLDGFIEDPDGKTDWVDSWADAIQLIDDVDTFLLGGHMYPGYGEYWGSIYADPQAIPPNPEVPSQQGRPPSSSEIAYAQLAARTPHIVLSTTLESVSWPETQIVRDLAALQTLKDTPGKNIYVVGGAGLVASLMDANLIDELRLIVHPIVLGSGKPLFEGIRPHPLEFVQAQPGKSGRVMLTYRTAV
ncbi:dihydrofolate reductase family protein [Niabella beijingensis]|uniref:dihydrofolate reductase family protein n=1 Tax=Niabella beijingensis TaxID=2872700 RepID=UPI001CBDD2DF|nr:dihydrofolate reductase family protein [Niabella beijingensis]MBZ4192269.1 dihydrofolate reductase family protein [Niabella beijingensis]